MTNAPLSRRLLDAKAVAAKLKYSRKWFDENRKNLEADGFPKPCLGNDSNGHPRWDEVAIDLWFDSKMEPDLLLLRNRPKPFANQDTSHLLKQRAERLAL